MEIMEKFWSLKECHKSKNDEMIMILRYPLEPNKAQLIQIQIIYIAYSQVRDVI